MSLNFASGGKILSDDRRPLTCPATSCSVFWPTGFRPISLVTWMAKVGTGSPEDAGQHAVDQGRRNVELRPGTVLGREWYGHMQRVTVLADGFSWNGKTYPSLSKTAFAITGTRWNGPKFFGLRAKSSKETAL
jgi:hypothetical protein